MKKNIIIAVMSVFTLASIGMAGDWVKKVSKVLRTPDGQEIAHPGAMAKSYTRLASATGVVVCTGECLLFDVILTSGASSSYAVIENTGTAESLDAVVFKAKFSGSTPVALSNGSNAFPILFDTGITADLSSASAGEEITVIYKDLD